MSLVLTNKQKKWNIYYFPDSTVYAYPPVTKLLGCLLTEVKNLNCNKVAMQQLHKNSLKQRAALQMEKGKY